jgi:cobyrinic acid a,c-diamide synthase
MKVSVPRLIIAGLSGDSGKTIISLSILTAMRKMGLVCAPFKKGPDYIDAAWLGKAAGNYCRNLDTYLTGRSNVQNSFVRHSMQSDIAIIEGNRGIFDGKDLAGTHSTAELAKLLQCPVVLVINCAKMTRTVAAMIQGCMTFDPAINIAGVILNRVAGERHRKIITDSIGEYCNLPVWGALPKFSDRQLLIPNRHLGLIPPSEFAAGNDLGAALADIAVKYLDINSLLSAARTAEPLPLIASGSDLDAPSKVKIGYFSDPVFTFYYPENLEALRKHGADLIKISSLDDKSLPSVDALYIGGGFPETYAEHLAKNKSLLLAVKRFAEKGGPIYAECGGLIYLSRSLVWNENRYPMADLFAADLIMNARPAGHGYTQVKIDRPNPVFPVGSVIKGHEFHYSSVSAPEPLLSCMKMQSGTGLGNGRDGLVFKSTMACYTHIHADGVDSWAPAMIRNAMKARAPRRDIKGSGKEVDKSRAPEKLRSKDRLPGKSKRPAGDKLQIRHSVYGK